ncbi:Ubiquitin-associated protein 2 [Halotydeus destructor]|nr:Ubiquitin-associated protein 2 [Halotydeus destructor]
MSSNVGHRRGGANREAGSYTVKNSSRPAPPVQTNELNEKNLRSSNEPEKQPLQPTQEQIRIALLMNENTDLSDLQFKVEKIVSVTNATAEQAAVALHDCENDLDRAVTSIMEGDFGDDDDWKRVSTKNKKEKKLPVKEGGPRKEHNENFKNSQNGGSDRPKAMRGGKAPRGRDDRNEHRGERPPRRIDDGETREPFDPERKYRDDRGERPARGGFTGERGGRGGARGGRGGLRGRGGISRGAPVVGGGTSGRTFRPTPTATTGDGFPNSIDTWTNSTVDDKAPVSTAPLAVGNWSDVVGNDDHWSEEDYDDLMETKVFTPSSAKIDENLATKVAAPRMDMASLLKQNSASDSKQQPPQPLNFSSVLAGSNRPGRDLLQSLQQPQQAPPVVAPQQQQQSSSVVPNQAGQYTQSYTNQSFVNKQAADSIKNLVGISTAGYSNAAALGQSQGRQDKAADQSKAQTRYGQQQQRKPGRIPESAVEMPTSDSISSLGVQFGALDFGNDANVFAGLQGSDVSTNYDHLSKTPVKNTPASQGISERGSGGGSMPTRSTLNPYRPQGVDQTKTSDLLKNMSQGLNQPDTGALSSVNNNKGGYASNKGLDSANKNDLYGQSSNQGSDLNSYKVPYNPAGSYGAGNYAGAAAAAGPPYVYSTAGPGYGSIYGNSVYQGPKNLSLKDNLDTNQAKSQSVGYDLHSAAGLVNSTMTTNVLKNSLSATGSKVGIPSLPQSLPQMIPPYIMPGAPFAYAAPPMGGMYDPMSMAAGRADSQFTGYPSTTDVKYSRSDAADVSSAVSSASSQAGVNQNPGQHPFMGQLPPGYGFYFTPMPSPAGMHYTQPPVFPTMPPVTNTGAAGPAFNKQVSSGYGSHSYSSGAYDPSALTGASVQDYSKNPYGQSSQQSKSNLVSTGDLMGSQNPYAKTHSQMSKGSYDKLPYQGGNQQFGMASSGYNQNPYAPLAGQNLNLQHSGLQGDNSSQGNGNNLSGNNRNNQSGGQGGPRSSYNYGKQGW